MRVLVDDRVIPVYPQYDNLDTIINRMAFELKTLPRFITVSGFPSEKTPQTVEEKKFDNLINLNLSGTSLFKVYRTKSDPPNDESHHFAFLKAREYNTLGELEKFALLSMTGRSERFYQDYNDVYSKELDIFLKQQSDSNKALELLSVQPSVFSFEPEIEKTVYEYFIDLKDQSLDSLYNSIKLKMNEDVILIRYNDKVKFNNTYNFEHSDFQVGATTFLILFSEVKKNIGTGISGTRILITDVGPPPPFDNTSTSRWYKMVVEIAVHQQPDAEYYQNFIKNLTKAEKQIKMEESIMATFFVPMFQISNSLFMDCMMNNPVFTRFIEFDESRKVQKEKDYIYTYFTLNENKITAQLNCELVEVSNREVIRRSRVDFPLGSWYLRVKVKKSKSMAFIYEYRKIFTQILSVYIIERDNLIKEYKKLGLDTETIIKQHRKKQNKNQKVLLKHLVPEIFGLGSKCENKKNPRIVDDDISILKEMEGTGIFESSDTGFNAYENIGDYKIAIRYPKDTGHWFACDNKDFPYVGLKENTFDNKREYPFQPCCYKTIQHLYSVKKGVVNKYYHGQEQSILGTGGKYIVTGDKPLPFGRKGYLSRDMDYFLRLINLSDFNPNKKDNIFGGKGSQNSTIPFQLLRMGVFSDSESLFESVALALHPSKNPTVDEIEKFHSELWIKFINDPNTVPLIFASGEFNNPDDVRYELVESNVYLEPGIYARAIEKVFGVRIIILDRYGVKLPSSTFEYLEYPVSPDEKYIILFENTHYNKRRTELVVLSQGDSEIRIHSASSKLVYQLIKKMKDLYPSIYKRLPNVPVPPEMYVQHIDRHGKVVALSNNNQDILLFTLNLPLNPSLMTEIWIDYTEKGGERYRKILSNPNSLIKYCHKYGYTIHKENGIEYIQNQDQKYYLITYKKSVLKEFNTQSQLVWHFRERITTEHNKRNQDKPFTRDSIIKTLKTFVNIVPKTDIVMPINKFNISQRLFDKVVNYIISFDANNRKKIKADDSFYRMEDPNVIIHLKGAPSMANYRAITPVYKTETSVPDTDKIYKNYYSPILNSFNKYTSPVYLRFLSQFLMIFPASSLENAIGIEKKYRELGTLDQHAESDPYGPVDLYILENKPRIVSFGINKDYNRSRVLVWRKDGMIRFGAILE